MTIQIQCAQCGITQTVEQAAAGSIAICEACGADIDVHADAQPVEVEPVADGPFEAEPVDAVPIEVEPVKADVAPIAVDPNFANGSLADQDPPAVNLLDDDDDDDDGPIRKKRPEDELDMTPMVDVTFLLLIFFMVTASFSLQKSIPMPRQTSDLPSTSNVEEETEELDPVELEIDEFGAFLVIGPRGEQETVGKQNLIAVLRSEAGESRDAMRLNIKVHENAKLQFMVDGMDAGTIAGFSELQVTQVDGFD